jgi:hypothetical protein
MLCSSVCICKQDYDTYTMVTSVLLLLSDCKMRISHVVLLV